MSCKHPLTRIEIHDPSRKSDNGKYPGVIVSWIPPEKRLPHLMCKPYYDYPLTYQDIPCGQCIGCRLDHARQWADRIMLEASLYPSDTCWFLTVTYNDLYLPIMETGNPGLVKRDMQLFFKRLRRSLDHPCRFYLAGEYGDETFRPHYHICLFGVSKDELQLVYYKQSGDHGQFELSNSDLLQSCWTFLGDLDDDVIAGLDLDNFYNRDPRSKGYIVVAPLSWDTACYVSRYVTKKLKGEQGEFYSLAGIEPPFSLMSRRPGIGAGRYYDGVLNEYVLDVFPGVKRVHEIKPPKYFERIFERLEPEKYDVYKQSRRDLAQQKLKERIAGLSVPYLEELAKEERSLQNALKSIDFRENLV